MVIVTKFIDKKLDRNLIKNEFHLIIHMEGISSNYDSFLSNLDLHINNYNKIFIFKDDVVFFTVDKNTLDIVNKAVDKYDKDNDIIIIKI